MKSQVLLALRYIKYLFVSKTRFSVHSPFVFDLLTNVLQSKRAYYSYAKIDKSRAKLLANQSKIEITDLGAGSLVNNKKQKKISDIAKLAAKPDSLGKILFELTNYFQPKNVIELGTSLGMSSLYLYGGCKASNYYTLEGCPETAKVAAKNFLDNGIKDIKIVTGDFKETLPLVISKLDKVDFVFFDGNHQKQPTLDYFYLCLEKATDESVFVFDDIHWSEGMEEAWEEIKKHPKVKVSVDIFWLGLVFFKTDQVEEHFILNTII
jgi:predicted O-methyltransferase YrrM